MDFTTLGYYAWFLPGGRCRGDGARTPSQGTVALSFRPYVFFWLASGWHVILLATSTRGLVHRKTHRCERGSEDQEAPSCDPDPQFGLLVTFKYLDM